MRSFTSECINFVMLAACANVFHLALGLGAYYYKSQLEAHMSLHNEKWSTDEHRRCKLCRKQFTKPVLYRQHLRDHYKLQLKSAKQTRRGIRHRTAYKCKVCLKVFQKPSQLARHIRVHTGEKPYKCNICSRSFTQKSSVRVHMWYHNKIRPYSCSLCHAKFSQKSNLSSHELRVHREPEGDGEARLSYRCIHCPCTFKRLASLTNHLRRSHATDSQTSPDSQLTGANEATAEQGEEAPRANGQRLEHRLADLGESHNPEPAEGRDELELEPHRPGDGFVLMDEKENTAVVTLIDKDAQNAKGKYVKLKQRLVNDSRLYECSFCHKTFKKPSDLLRHLRVHTKEKPFKCEICGQSFALKLTLQTHEKIHARVIEKIPCPMCKAMLNSEKGLFDHIGKYHRCTLCEKRYASLEEQTSHALVHLNSAPTEERSKAKAKLPTEVQSLARQVVLQEPLVITETGNGLVRAQPRYCNELARGKGRPHKCPGCPAAFMKLSHLKQHYRKHTGERPFSCPLCDRKFVTNSALKAHRRIHECSRPYRCSVCGQRFTTLSGMKRHHLKHTNKRPFMCPYCNKTFKSTVNCKKHMQIHKTEIAQQQLELQKKQQQPPQAGLNKPVIISDQKITFQPITANLSLNLNDQIQNLMCNQKISDSCVPGSSMIQNNQPLPQTIPVVSNPNIGSAQTLHADETGTVTLSNYSGSQTLTSESIKELEETLNQQLLSLGVNFALSNNAQQMIEQKNTSGETQEQPILSIIYDNGATLQSPVTLNTLAGGDNLHILASQLNAFDINQIALQNNEIHMEVTPTNSETVLQNQAHSLPLISNDFQFHTSIEPKEANIISHQSNDLLINSDNVSVKENNVVVAKEANLQCHICDVQKLSENELKEHLKTHQEKQKYQCTHCSSKFCSLRSLSRHIKIHEVQEKHKCYECNQEFPTSLQLREHIKDHVKKELKQKNPENAEDVIKELESENKNKGNKKNSTSNTCQYCSKIFRKPSDLIRHVRTHTGERPYQCNFCQKSFAVKCTLDSHLKIHSNEKSFHCNVCNNMFSTKGSLKVHMRLHTGSKPFNCPMCEMTFRTSGHRKVHLLSHAKESKCQKLKRKLTSIGLLADEVENLAENTSAAEVSEMQAEFKQMYPECFEAESEVVEQKQNAVNDNDQNFEQLEIPGEMSFSSDVADGELMNLSEHSQIVANLQFLLANGLVTIQTEDPASNQVSLATTSIVPSDFELSHNQKPVEETIAPQIFFNADSLPDSTVPNARTEEANLALNNYMVLQLDSVDSTVQIRNGELEEAAAQSPSGGTRRECEECGKTFAKPCQLERHKRVHTGERPFKCDQCDKSFSQKSSLTMHQYSHTGDRPYPCSQCERSFTQSYNLQTHMRRVHKVEPAEAKRLAKAQQFFHYDPKMPSPTLITDTPLTLHDLAFNDMLK